MTERLSTEQIILLVIAILVIVATIYILISIFAPNLFPWAKKIGTPIGETDAQQNSDNFDAMAKNIDACSLIKDSDCICEVFPLFPGTFKGTTLSITKGDTGYTFFELKNGKELIKKDEFASLSLGAKLISKEGTGTNILSYSLQDLPEESNMLIDWTKTPPTFTQGAETGTNFWTSIKKLFKKDGHLASGSVYINPENKLYLLASFESDDAISFVNKMRKCGVAKNTADEPAEIASGVLFDVWPAGENYKIESIQNNILRFKDQEKVYSVGKGQVKDIQGIPSSGSIYIIKVSYNEKLYGEYQVVVPSMLNTGSFLEKNDVVGEVVNPRVTAPPGFMFSFSFKNPQGDYYNPLCFFTDDIRKKVLDANPGITMPISSYCENLRKSLV